MAKHPRKKQRLAKAAASDVQPLGSAVSLADDAGKDDEERRLESLLFGTHYEPSGDAGRELVVSDDEPEETGAAGEKELQNLLDTDLFFVDDGVGRDTSAGARETVGPQDQSSGEESQENSAEEDVISDDEAAENSYGDEEVQAEPIPNPSPLAQRQTQRKAPAWTDPDDTTLEVSLASDTRLRKLRDALSEDTVGGREYERRLRRQFEKINPAPDWAAAARKKGRSVAAKRRRTSSSASSDSDADADAWPELLSSTNGVVAPTRKVKLQVLPQGTLAIERLRDANLSAKTEGEVKAIQFHPSPQVPVLLTAGSDRRLRLFNIDGHTNPHLQTVHVPSLPLTNALFHPGGTSVLLTGPRPFYYVYDLQSGTALRSPRGLWGTFGGPHAGAEDRSMEVCAFDPTGALLAVAGRRGHVHLADWRAGQGQVVASVKMNAGVKAVWWADGRLMSLGEDAEVYVWDVGERRCLRRWKDEGGFGSRVMGGDRAGKHLAIGAKTGLVNVYGPDGVSSSGSNRPKPLKTIGNLTTSITSLRFNHDSQLLAVASNTKKDQMRMIHLPSLTVFANWPTSSTPLGHVTSIDFSSGSEYVAVGNNRGRVLLYHLRDFAPQ
ncbi:WD40 repeat-like protein [Amylocystis lapponica]|nr:WD40 repeat-like protein [Amylocystis lapponica]